MIWILMALMCLYGFFGDETWLPEDWRQHIAVDLAILAALFAGGALMHPDWIMAACWTFSCIMLHIGATRYGWKA